jgi:hypothetical protein
MEEDAMSPPSRCVALPRATIVAATLLLPRFLAGQLPIDQSFSQPSLLPRAEIDQAISGSRFRLGSVYLTPVLALTQATYDNNIYGTTSNPTGDFLATVSAGVDMILPLGKGVFLRAGAFPAYTWYAQLVENRFLGGQYGAGFLIFSNRLTVEGAAAYSRQNVIYSSESQALVIQNLGTVRLEAEYRILNRLYAYAGGGLQDLSYAGPGVEAGGISQSTDRKTGRVRAEIRYRPSESVRISGGYEWTRADFVYNPSIYDNTTRSVIGDVYYDRGKLFAHLSGGYMQGSPAHGSTVPPFSGFIGSASLSYSLLRPLNVGGYATRYLTYGQDSPYYVSTRYGASLTVKVGWRLNLQGFGYLGTDSYSTPTSVPGVGLVDRVDDVTGYGAGLNLQLTSRAQLQFLATEEQYNSNVPGVDRSYFRWTVSLSLGGNLLK